MQLNQGNGRAPSGARSDSTIRLSDGETLPFSSRELSTADIPADRRQTVPRLPRESEVDWDGPKTHRIICLHTNAQVTTGVEARHFPARYGQQGDVISPARTEHVRRYRKIVRGDEAWVSAGEAAVLEQMRVCKVIEVRDDGRCGEADPGGEEADPAGEAGEGRRVATPSRSGRRG